MDGAAPKSVFWRGRATKQARGTLTEMIGAIVIEGSKSLECSLAVMLAKHGAEPVVGIGCTDCRCGSHSFRL